MRSIVDQSASPRAWKMALCSLSSGRSLAPWRATAAITAAPEFRAKAEEQGAVVRPMTPAELGARVERELAEWAEVVRAGNITAD